MHLLLLFALSVFAASDDHLPSASHGDAIVKSVSWENQDELSSVQQTKLSSVLVGKCFNREESSELSRTVLDQLRKFGYKRAFVQDPTVRLLDSNVRPSPAAVTIDFV